MATQAELLKLAKEEAATIEKIKVATSEELVAFRVEGCSEAITAAIGARQDELQADVDAAEEATIAQIAVVTDIAELYAFQVPGRSELVNLAINTRGNQLMQAEETARLEKEALEAAEDGTDGLIAMYNGRNCLRVHPTCVSAHIAVGWAVQDED